MIVDNEHTLRCAYFCVAEVIRHRRIKGQPIPKWLRRHYQHLERELTISIAMSHLGPDSDPGMKELNSKPELITAREAAAILGLSRRQVTRKAKTLDGNIVDGRWLFNRATIIEHLEYQKELERQHA